MDQQYLAVFQEAMQQQQRRLSSYKLQQSNIVQVQRVQCVLLRSSWLRVCNVHCLSRSFLSLPVTLSTVKHTQSISYVTCARKEAQTVAKGCRTKFSRLLLRGDSANREKERNQSNNSDHSDDSWIVSSRLVWLDEVAG